MNSSLSWRIIRHFSQKKTFGFTLQDVVGEFPGYNRDYLARMLARMVKEKFLCKISRSIYHIIPQVADPECYRPDPLQVAKYFFLHKAYYIGYSSALGIHGLISPSRARLEVVTINQVKPSIRNIGGIECRFIQHHSTRFFGFKNNWINFMEQAMVSDLEKTIVDISTNPCLCGGIAELGKTLQKSDSYTSPSYWAWNGTVGMSECRKFLGRPLHYWTRLHRIGEGF